MKIKKILKSSVPHLAILAIFIMLATIYFFPVLEGKTLHQMDGSHATAMAKEVVDFKEDTGKISMWTNSAFGGMPAYQIKGDASNNIFWYINHVVRFGLPYSTIAIMFVYMLGFYIFLLSLKVNKWLSMLGAVAYALISYNIIIIDAGHITKAYAIGLMAPVLAGFILTFEKKYIIGAVIALITLGLQIAVNHVQITYYVMLMVILMGIYYFIKAVQNLELKQFGKSVAILFAVAILAIGPNITQLWTTYEYGKESIRGESELTPEEGERKSSGLDKNYALDWSYGKKETLTLLIPNAVGGSSVPIGSNQTALEEVIPEMRETIANQYQYWGSQPFTSGPVYVGAIIFLLFVLGFVIVKSSIKWWILAATILSVFLAWGKNMEWFTDIFFYYVPLYNKFRTVAMALVIAGVTIPLMAILALKEMFENPKILKEKQTKVFATIATVAGIVLFLYIFPSVFNYISAEEYQAIEQQKADLMQNPQIQDKTVIDNYIREYKINIENARIAIFKADAMRTFIFIILAGGILYLFSRSIINKKTTLGILGLLIVIDLWVVDLRYLNYDKFEDKQYLANEFAPSTADNFILKDEGLDFRVLNLTRSPFNDAHTSYFHKSIGGYHGAKLRRYQDVIEKHLMREITTLRGAIQSQNENDPTVFNVLTRTNVLNMLNTRYLIYDPSQMPIINMNALGNAWFVTDYEIVENADNEIKALMNFDPTKTAVIDKRFVSGDNKIELPETEFFEMDTGSIHLTNYAPNRLVYETKNPKTQLAVFSEVYYDKGWNAYIDGEKTPHIRANYILRAMVIPKGEHVVEFRFEPKSYYAGNMISLILSIIVFLLIVVGTWYSLKQIKVNEVTDDNEIKPKTIVGKKTKHRTKKK